MDTEKIFMKIEEEPEVEEPKEAPAKKKRTLTEKQKKALQEGRQRAKEKRALKLADEVKFRDSQDLKKEAREKKKVTKKRQQAQEKMLRNEKIAQFDSKVNAILGAQSCSKVYSTLEKYCDTFTDDDKVNPHKAQAKILGMIKHLEKYM